MNIFGKLLSDPSKLIGVGMAALGLAQMVLGNKQASYERKAMKAEIRKEVLDELTKSSN